MREQPAEIWPDEVRPDGVCLRGTIAAPDDAGAHPAALLLNGSGPLDRDSNMPGQRLDILNVLAAGLAASGIASLRFDKRGVGSSDGDYLTASFTDETDDAVCALAALRADPVCNGRVAVIGHSVGATIAMRLVRAAVPPDAFVFLAGAALPGEQVMAWQSRRIAETAPIPRRWLRARDERKQAALRAALSASAEPSIEIDGQQLPASWFREYMAYDPVADLSAIAVPVLAITGRSDLQVDPADVAAIGRHVAGPFTGETPDHLTHLLRIDRHPPSLRRYTEQIGRPVDDAVIARVAGWTSAHLQ